MNILEVYLFHCLLQNSHTATLLFSGWSTDEGFAYAGMIVICFIAGVLAVVFKYLRNEMEIRLFNRTEREKYSRYAITTTIFERSVMMSFWFFRC